MTREEAINHLITVRNTCFASGYDSAVEDACKMAIKALEQELCDKCEVGNPCLYCKHEFEPQESEVKE